MKLRDTTRIAMVAALQAVRQYADGTLDKTENWDDVLFRVEEAWALYEADLAGAQSEKRGGSSYNPALPENEERRHKNGLGMVWMMYARGLERTPADVAAATGYGSVKRRIRELATAACGGWCFQKRLITSKPHRVYTYRMLNPDATFIEVDQYLPKGDG